MVSSLCGNQPSPLALTLRPTKVTSCVQDHIAVCSPGPPKSSPKGTKGFTSRSQKCLQAGPDRLEGGPIWQEFSFAELQRIDGRVTTNRFGGNKVLTMTNDRTARNNAPEAGFVPKVKESDQRESGGL